MRERNIIFKTKPNYFTLFLVTIGGVFFIYWAYIIFSKTWIVKGADKQTGNTIIVVVFILFAGFAIACFALVIGFKVFYVTQDYLLIRWPALFYNRRILLSDIIRINQKDEPVFLKGREVFRGRKATIELVGGRCIKLTTFEVWGYRGLIKALRKPLVKQ